MLFGFFFFFTISRRVRAIEGGSLIGSLAYQFIGMSVFWSDSPNPQQIFSLSLSVICLIYLPFGCSLVVGYVWRKLHFWFYQIHSLPFRKCWQRTSALQARTCHEIRWPYSFNFDGAQGKRKTTTSRMGHKIFYGEFTRKHSSINVVLTSPYFVFSVPKFKQVNLFQNDRGNLFGYIEAEPINRSMKFHFVKSCKPLCPAVARVAANPF